VLQKQTIFPALFSGLLLGVTTIGHGPVYHLHWALFFGFVPLWSIWLREASWKKILFSGWLCQFTFTLVAFHWLAYTVNEFSHLGLPLSVFILLFYCALANLQFPLAGLLWHWIFRKPNLGPLPQIAALALLTAACERIGTMIFHWNFGYAWLYMGWPGAQIADVVGFKWLCTFSICLNGVLLVAWIERKNAKWILPVILAATAFTIVNFAGMIRVRQLSPPDAKARVLLIQPNVGNREKEKLDTHQDFREASLQNYFSFTDKALASPNGNPVDFAVWPENAFPDVIADAQLTYRLSAKLKEYIKSRKLNLLTGSYGMNVDGKITNSLFALSKDGTWSSPPYHKMLLLPFGEYIPGAERFPVLKKWLPDVRDYGHGEAPVILALENIRLGPQICYEGLFDFVSRDLANRGAQIIVNVTNDSWYGNWMEPWQHLYITMAKAIETRRPLIRDTNTGLSAVILADGTIPEISPIDKEWFHAYDVPFLRSPPTTPFMKWGFWFDWIFLGAGLSALWIWSRFQGKIFGCGSRNPIRDICSRFGQPSQKFLQ